LTLINIRVQPRSSQRKVAPDGFGGYKVWITAPPVDGAANEAVIDLLSDLLGRKVTLVKGHSGRSKVVSVDMTAEEVASKLG